MQLTRGSHSSSQLQPLQILFFCFEQLVFSKYRQPCIKFLEYFYFLFRVLFFWVQGTHMFYHLIYSYSIWCCTMFWLHFNSLSFLSDSLPIDFDCMLDTQFCQRYSTYQPNSSLIFQSVYDFLCLSHPFAYHDQIIFIIFINVSTFGACLHLLLYSLTPSSSSLPYLSHYKVQTNDKQIMVSACHSGVFQLLY